MDQFDKEGIKILSWVYKNPMVKIPLLLLLAIYFIMSPKLPHVVLLIYNNIAFKILIILLIIFLSLHDKQLALMISAVYLLTLKNLNNTDDSSYHTRNICRIGTENDQSQKLSHKQQTN